MDWLNDNANNQDAEDPGDPGVGLPPEDDDVAALQRAIARSQASLLVDVPGGAADLASAQSMASFAEEQAIARLLRETAPDAVIVPVADHPFPVDDDVLADLLHGFEGMCRDAGAPLHHARAAVDFVRAHIGEGFADAVQGASVMLESIIMG